MPWRPLNIALFCGKFTCTWRVSSQLAAADGVSGNRPQQFSPQRSVTASLFLVFYERRCRISHVVTVKTEVRDLAAIQAACRRLGLPPAVHKVVKLFSDTKTGFAVQLPKWNYPVVCDLASGQLHYDNYQGHWGNPVCLDAFVQSYAVEKARIEAKKKGYSVSEQLLPSGEIKLTIRVEGGAA